MKMVDRVRSDRVRDGCGNKIMVKRAEESVLKWFEHEGIHLGGIEKDGINQK